MTAPFTPFLNSAPPYYINATPSASLKSTAVFGELYWDATDTLKWTAGLRYTRDEKGMKDRQMLFSVPVGDAADRDGSSTTSASTRRRSTSSPAASAST